MARSRLHQIKLAAWPRRRRADFRPSRFTSPNARISLSSNRKIFGRHIVDTFFSRKCILSHRSLESFGLKDVDSHFGVSASDGKYVEGGNCRTFDKIGNRHALRARRTSSKRSPSADILYHVFLQAQMLRSHTKRCVRGNGTKIEPSPARILREAVISQLTMRANFEGVTTSSSRCGEETHHCDVRSLLPVDHSKRQRVREPTNSRFSETTP